MIVASHTLLDLTVATNVKSHLLVVGTKFRLDKVFESELENLVFRVIEYNKDDTGAEI